MNELQSDVSLLRSIQLFSNIPPKQLKLLAFASERVELSAGQILFSQGDVAGAAYVIIDGAVDVLVTPENGRENLIVVRGRNEIIGEMAILSDHPRSATVRARGKLVCLRIKKEHFLEILAESPKLWLDVVRVLVERLETATMELAVAHPHFGNIDFDS